MFKPTTSLHKILQLKKRIRAVTGGTAASKTISILMWLIDYSQTTENKITTVVSESYPHLEGGAIRDFKTIMVQQRYWKDSAWNESKHIYTFPGGSKIEFKAIDKFGKAHGPRRDILFLNEANNIPYNIADQLITRTREVVWMDWNPSTEFWFYNEMLGKRDDVDFIGENGNVEPLTYKDNEALDKSTIKEIEAHRSNASWWKVYGEGKMGEIEGRIYKHWNFIDEIPYEAKLIRTGVDFGYSIDPTSIVDIYQYNQGFIVDEVVYSKGMSNQKIADTLRYKEQQAIVIADSAEPKSIDEIAAHGVSILPSVKGPGSVTRGIDYVQSQKISVTKRSVHTIKEYRNYIFYVDKDGKIDGTKEDPLCANHSMSAIRYALASLRPNETNIISQLEKRFHHNELALRESSTR